MLRAGSAVADIGCDHGKLAVWLALSGRHSHIIATDVAPLPLKRAQQAVAHFGCGGIVSCRLGSGLEPLQKGEVQDVVIAGLSGETIAEILAPYNRIAQPNMQLILLPTTRHPFLRAWLYEHGFCISKERIVHENKRYYTVISAHYTGQSTRVSDVFCQLGLTALCEDALVQGYINARLNVLRKQALGLCGEAAVQHQKLIQEVEDALP